MLLVASDKFVWFLPSYSYFLSVLWSDISCDQYYVIWVTHFPSYCCGNHLHTGLSWSPFFSAVVHVSHLFPLAAALMPSCGTAPRKTLRIPCRHQSARAKQLTLCGQQMMDRNEQTNTPLSYPSGRHLWGVWFVAPLRGPDVISGDGYLSNASLDWVPSFPVSLFAASHWGSQSSPKS